MILPESFESIANAEKKESQNYVNDKGLTDGNGEAENHRRPSVSTTGATIMINKSCKASSEQTYSPTLFQEIDEERGRSGGENGDEFQNGRVAVGMELDNSEEDSLGPCPGSCGHREYGFLMYALYIWAHSKFFLFTSSLVLSHTVQLLNFHTPVRSIFFYTSQKSH